MGEVLLVEIYRIGTGVLAKVPLTSEILGSKVGHLKIHYLANPSKTSQQQRVQAERTETSSLLT